MPQLKKTLINPFLPNLAIHKLGPPGTPKEERFEAALLFADITGFTNLTERMAEKGPFGAEQLHKALVARFGDLIENIADHGGEVIKFAGDAILAAWSVPEDEDLSLAVRRACSAALEIQSTHNKTEKADDLQLRIGVAAGPVWLASIGGVEERWEILMAGGAVEQIGLATSQARPGDVILSPEAWSLVREHAIGRELTPNGCAGLDTVTPAVPSKEIQYPSVDAKIFLPYIPRVLQAHLEVGHEKLLPEFRQASVMFVNLPGMDFESVEILGRIHEVMRVIQTVVYRFGGSVNQLIADDKGTLAIAAWGLAFHTHEDDVIRSVRAGLKLHRELLQLGCRANIGIATGTVFTGMRGNARRADYALIGSTVNLAARLMQRAEATVLVDNATRIASRAQIVFEVLPKVYLKGVTGSLSIYRPVRKKTKPVTPGAELIGRADALELLLREMTNLQQSHPDHAVIVQGEPGIGKSRLIGALLDRSRSAAIRSLVCWGDPIEQSTSYFPWREVFFSLLEGVRASYKLPDSENRLAAVRMLLETAPDLKKYMSLLAPILSLELPENDETKNLSPEGRSEKCRALLCHLFRESVGTLPTLLVLEDVHWFDHASLSLIHALRGLKNPTLIVLTSRVVPRSEANPALIRLQNERDITKIRLSPLDQKSMLALAGARLGVDSLSSSFVTFLNERTDGNPFLIEQLCLSIQETGLIRLGQGECQVVDETALAEYSVPPTVKSLISSRIDRLSPREQLAIKVASVIGRSFDFDLLAKVMPEAAPRDELLDHLYVMDEMELVVKKDRADKQFKFKHAMTCDVAYDLLTLAQRRELHQSVAEAIEESHKGDPAPVCSVLAFHYTRAGKTDSAIKWLTMAGDQAFANFANREAARFYEQALELSSPSDTLVPVSQKRAHIDPVAHLNLILGQAHINARSYALGAKALERGVIRLGLPIPSSPLRAGLAAVGQLARQLLHRLIPAAFIGVRNKNKEKLLRAASAYEALGEVYYFTQRPIECFTSVLRGLNIAETAGPSSVLAREYASLGATLGLTPLYKAAENHFKRAFDTATQLDDPGTTTWVTMVYGIHRVGMGDWENAERLFRQVVELSDQTGDRRRKLDGWTNLAYLAYLQGDLASVQNLAGQVLNSVSVTGDRTNEEGARRVLIYCYSAMGEFGTARTQLEILKEMTEEGHAGDELASKIDYFSFSALIYAYEMQFEQALEAANDALRICLHNTSAIGYYTSIISCEAMTEALLMIWELSPDLSVTAKMAKKSTAIATKLARTYPIGIPKALMLKGICLWLRGRHKKAMSIWERSLETAVRMKMPVHAAHAELELARHKPYDANGRKSALDRLHSTYEQLGMHLYAKRTLQEMLTPKR